MTRAAAIGADAKFRRSSRGNRFRPGSGRGGGRRIRPGRAVVWFLGLGAVLALVAALSVGLLLGFRWVTITPFFALDHIEVTGNARLTEEDILALADVELGVNTLDLRISDVERRVAAEPWTEMVAVRRALPSGLVITVTERVPAYWVRTAKGLFYTEADGSVIAPVLADRFTACPVLEVAPQAGLDLTGLNARLAELDAAGLPVRAAQAAWVRVLPERLQLFFEDQGLALDVALDRWDGNLKRLSMVWDDLARRGEADSAKAIRIFGGKAWVRS